MPLSKERNRKRMREVRLHKTLERINVQPKIGLTQDRVQSQTALDYVMGIDADGNVIYEG